MVFYHLKAGPKKCPRDGHSKAGLYRTTKNVSEYWDPYVGHVQNKLKPFYKVTEWYKAVV
jgi:hypothetical protein